MKAPRSERFRETTFRASLSDVRFTPQGEVKVALLVPYADKHLTWAMTEAYGIQLEVNIKRRSRK